MNPTLLSIVIPVLNEAPSIGASLACLQPLREQGAEVIVVDGGSDDDSVLQAQPCADVVMDAPRGRARQMNVGAASAHGAILLFLHADTQLPPGADGLIRKAIEAGGVWGRFDVRIVGQHPMLRVVAILMNWRSCLTGLATGDQAMFVRRDVFERVGGFPDQLLMEDIELSQRLRRLARPVCITRQVATSGRRWETLGVWRTIFLMWRLRWRYWRGESAEHLAEAYR
ncbi:MAG: glycosyltransferase family 2 protein [Polaromonas sp.]|nr:glycosyltransferase family 2 protein [Polaromonas sp.]